MGKIVWQGIMSRLFQYFRQWTTASFALGRIPTIVTQKVNRTSAHAPMEGDVYAVVPLRCGTILMGGHQESLLGLALFMYGIPIKPL